MKTVVLRKVLRKGVCGNRYCQRKMQDGRTFCSSCRARLTKRNNRIRYAYTTIKSNAKKRGIPFTLTMQEFKDFCQRTGYLEGKGNSAGSLTVDRKDNARGYHADNIQVLTRSENAIKFHHTDKTPFCCCSHEEDYF